MHFFFVTPSVYVAYRYSVKIEWLECHIKIYIISGFVYMCVCTVSIMFIKILYAHFYILGPSAVCLHVHRNTSCMCTSKYSTCLHMYVINFPFKLKRWLRELFDTPGCTEHHFHYSRTSSWFVFIHCFLYC